ncbi:S-layer homology domain-containing protein [Candidatus Peregrinibacteria bacterium]|nr:S-layer homology domain-containing protein [Candidatus Peregrinibacteria bacterium]
MNEKAVLSLLLIITLVSGYFAYGKNLQDAKVSVISLDSPKVIEDFSDFNNSVFDDVAIENENFNAIYFLKNTGVISGYKSKDTEEVYFKPENPVNRAEFLKIIYEGNNLLSNKNYDSCFPDVPDDAWFAPYVCQAEDDQVVSGYDDGFFRPEKTINQAEALKILGEALDWQKAEIANNDPWYQSYLIPATEMNVLPGKEIGDLMTRGDIAEIIFRNTQVQTLKVDEYQKDLDTALFQLNNVPLQGPLAPNGLLGPLGPLSDDFFAPNSKAALLSEDFFLDNYCYYSDQGDFSGDALEFLQQFSKEDFDKYIEGSDIDDFGKMFCYKEEKDNELAYFSKELRAEYDVICWRDREIPTILDDGSEEIFCYTDSDANKVEFPQYLEVNVEELPPLKLAYDEDEVEVLKLRLGAAGKEDVTVNGLEIYNLAGTFSDAFDSFTVKDDEDVLFSNRIQSFQWQESTLELVFNTPLIVPKGEGKYLHVYADLDWEYSDGEIMLGLRSAKDILTEAIVDVGVNLAGPLLALTKALVIEEEDFPLCILFEEANSANENTQAAPSGTGTTVAPQFTPSSHMVVPIDQMWGTCFAAATYASLRWLEQYLEIDDLIVDGMTGYNKLIELLHPPEKFIDFHDWYDQYQDLTELINNDPNTKECLDASFNTNWGKNVTCAELKQHFDKQCDVSLGIKCQSNTTKEYWGHQLDLVDVTIDANNPDKCRLVFANSWQAQRGETVVPGTDGFENGGVYQVGDYDYADSSFDVKAWWGPGYSCKMDAAMYICPKRGCKAGDYIFPIDPDAGSSLDAF